MTLDGMDDSRHSVPGDQRRARAHRRLRITLTTGSGSRSPATQWRMRLTCGKDPLPGVPAKKVLIGFVKGDQYVPDPTTTAFLRAGDLADRATFYRYDLAFPGRDPNTPPAPGIPAHVRGLDYYRL